MCTRYAHNAIKVYRGDRLGHCSGAGRIESLLPGCGRSLRVCFCRGGTSEPFACIGGGFAFPTHYPPKRSRGLQASHAGSCRCRPGRMICSWLMAGWTAARVVVACGSSLGGGRVAEGMPAAASPGGRTSCPSARRQELPPSSRIASVVTRRRGSRLSSRSRCCRRCYCGVVEMMHKQRCTIGLRRDGEQHGHGGRHDVRYGHSRPSAPPSARHW